MARANSGKKFTGTTFVTSGGGGGGSFNLTVEEQDGNPTVSNVNTIRVSNGTLTDEGGGVVRARAKKRELPKVDHATIEYAPFRKKFYIEVPEIKNMSDEQIAALRKELHVCKKKQAKAKTAFSNVLSYGLGASLLARRS